MMPHGMDGPRAQRHLREMEASYPQAWRQVARFREARGRGLPEWPNWCYMPLAGAYAIVSGGGDNKVPLERSLDISRLGALAAWRETQGLYLYDETLLAALWDTPVEGELPTAVLQHLPEWCVYITLPSPRTFGRDAYESEEE